MYDRRERAQLEYQWGLEGARRESREEGREEGLEKGLEKGREEGREGLVDTIIILQGIAGDPETTVDELQELKIDELNRLCAELRDRLRMRGC